MKRKCLVLAWAVGLGCIEIPPLVDCVSRTDCARDEVCQDGKCTVGTSVIRKISNGNNQMPPGSDAGFSDASAITDVGAGPIDAGHACISVRIEGQNNMYCTVAEAIAAASDNDKIVLPATHIYEHISVVNKPLTIAGSTAGSQKTRIIVQDSQGAIQIGASGTVIEHLEIDAPNAEAVRVASNATLRVIHVLSARGAGILVTGGMTTTVLIETPMITGVKSPSSNLDRGAGAGVKVEEGATVSIRDGEISGCAGSGVYVESGTLSVFRTVVKDNNFGVEAVNPNARAKPIVTLSGVELANNQRSGFHVVDSVLTASNCTATNNGRAMVSSEAHGFYLGTGTEATIQGNSCQMNVSYGIFCESGVVPSQCNGNSYSANGAMDTNCPGC